MGQKNNQRGLVRRSFSKGGFTLIEILLYVSIAGVILLATSVFLSLLLQARIKNQTIAEVEQQGLQVMQLITQATRNAEVLIGLPLGAVSSSLTLDVLTLLNDPTFDLVGGVIRVKEGAGSAIPLTNSRVIVSGLIFQNLSRLGTPGTIRITYTLSHTNPEGRNEYSYTRTFIGSATLRQP